MAFPEIRAVGTVAEGEAAIAWNAPAGIDAGDLLFVACETFAQQIKFETGNYVASGIELNDGTAATRLTVLMRYATGNETEGVRKGTDSGDHQLIRALCIKAFTWNFENPINVSKTNTQAATKSISVEGATTTVAETLALIFSAGSLPDAISTTEFSAFANANFGSVTERVDNASSAGNGGSLFVGSGTLATAKAAGNSTITAVTEAPRANGALFIEPFKIPEKGPYPVAASKVLEVTSTGDELTRLDSAEDVVLVEVHTNTINKKFTVTCTGQEVKEIGSQTAYSTGRIASFYFISKGGAEKVKTSWEGGESKPHFTNMTVIRGCDQTEPLHKFTEWTEKAEATTATADAVTTTAANCRIIVSSGGNVSGNEPIGITNDWTPLTRNTPMMSHHILKVAGESAKPVTTLSTARKTMTRTYAFQPTVVASTEVNPIVMLI